MRATGSEVSIVPADAQAQEILAALPASVDAVYLTPLPAMPETEFACSDYKETESIRNEKTENVVAG